MIKGPQSIMWAEDLDLEESGEVEGEGGERVALQAQLGQRCPLHEHLRGIVGSC